MKEIIVETMDFRVQGGFNDGSIEVIFGYLGRDELLRLIKQIDEADSEILDEYKTLAENGLV